MRKKQHTAPKAEVIDLVAEDELRRKQGARVAAFVNDLDLPPFVTMAVIDAVCAAARESDFKFTDGDEGRYAEELATLFTITPSGFQPAPRKDETRRDAEAIVRILNSPRVPANVRHELGRTIDEHVDEHRDHDPAIIAAVLGAALKGGAR